MAKDIRTVLFDLDGTLLDTARDLAAVLNTMLREHDRPPRDEADIRLRVSRGARAMTSFGFDMDPDDPALEPLRLELLERYRGQLAVRTCLFPGMDDVLDFIESSGRNWGVVTNKPAFLTDPLMQAIGLDRRAAAIVSGDTTAHSKPHPEPVLHACRLAGSEPAGCVLVGDDPRDVEAGKAAGTATLVAGFGYIAPGTDTGAWGADGYLDSAIDLVGWLDGPPA